MTDLTLIKAAQDAAEYAYAPYSSFAVGAALLCASGKVYCGCNIENAAFSPTICAERTADAKAISEGERNFVAIAIAAKKNGVLVDALSPCGVCRQVLSEFCDPHTFRILTLSQGTVVTHTLSALLPHGFSKSDLSQ